VPTVPPWFKTMHIPTILAAIGAVVVLLFFYHLIFNRKR
jgi:hypothetical protein